MKEVIMIMINNNCDIFKNVLLNLQFNCFFTTLTAQIKHLQHIVKDNTQ